MPSAKKSVTVHVDELEAMVDVLRAVAAGHTDVRVEGPFAAPALERLRQGLDEALSAWQRQSDEFHASSMELAMGVSECFSVLAEVRAGNLAARVSPATTNSSEEVIARLGQTLNATVADLRAQIETIEQQQGALHELSSPVLQVWDGVLVMPIIGSVDAHRSVDIMDTLLEEIAQQRAPYVILDITGAKGVDSATADHFIELLRAAELLGARCLLTGIRPAVARTLVELGVDLSSVETLRSLKDALAVCMNDGTSGRAAGRRTLRS